MSKLRMYSSIEQKNKFIAQHRPTLSKRELESVLDCLIAEQLNQGQVTHRFERSFSNTFAYPHALALNSLMAAYHIAFLALNLQPHDHVILSALSSEAACDAAWQMKANIHLLDLESDSFHPSEESVLALLTQLASKSKSKGKKGTKIVYIAEHSMGAPLAYACKPIKEAGALVIEDFTALPNLERRSSEENAQLNQQSDFGICGLSEYDLLTTGNGALLVSSRAQYYKLAHSLRYGAKRRPNAIAYDYRLGDFQAAMGMVQLSQLGVNLARRRKIASHYLESLARTKHETYFKNPELDCYLRFPVLIHKDPAEVKRYFRSLQIGISKIVERPLHHLLDLPPLQFPNAERLFRRSVCPPLYPSLNANRVERVSSALRGLL